MGAVFKGSASRGAGRIRGRAIGRYELHGELASGGMATVNLGRLRGEAGFVRTVAIKRLHAHFARDPEFVAMFVDEARLAARVRHPNVVPTLDVISEDGEIFLVMEYVPGESLSRLARTLQAKQERVPLPIAITLLVGVLHGLHAAHEARSEKGTPLEVVHRDVSPQNVLVGIDGSAHVLDFGVAKAAGRAQTTREGQIKGKLGYMAPEQLNDGAVTRQSDVYAAAVVLWELLTARRLFDADNAGAVLMKVMEAKIVAPSTLVEELPSALDAIVLRGLDRDPDKRWATAKDFALALEKSGTMASPSEVADWLQSVAGEELARRARKVAEMERASIRVTAAALEGATDDEPAFGQATPSFPEKASERPRELASGISSVSPSKSDDSAPLPAPVRGARGPLALVALGALVLLVTLFVIARRSSSPPTSVATAAAPSAPVASANAPAESETTRASAAPPATGTVDDAPAAAAPPPPPALVAPSHSAQSSPRPERPSAPSTRGAKVRPDCDPPFTTDAQGHKHYKLQCL